MKNLKRIVVTMSVLAIQTIVLAGCNVDSSSENSEKQASSNEVDNEILQTDVQDSATGEEYSNLELSNAKYSIPEITEVTNLKYAMPHTGADYEEAEAKILENIEQLGADATDATNLVYWGQLGSEYGTDAVVASDVATEEKNKYSYLTYNDGQYTAILYGGGGMLEMADSKLWAELAGSEVFDENYLPTYRPMFIEDAVLVEEYMLPEDSIEGISYTVLDGDLPLTDAVAFMEEELANYYFARSDYLEFKVYELDVYQLTSGEYYYYCFLQGYLDGIPVNYESGGNDPNENMTDEGYKSVVGIRDHVAMIYTDRISYFWSNFGYENAEVETVNTSDIISLDEAYEIVSENVTSESIFTITDVTMEYYIIDHTSYINPPSSDKRTDYREVRLVYKISVGNPRILDYSRIDFLVDVVTGELYTYVD